MATYTITINERYSGAKKFLDFMKTLNFVEIKKTSKHNTKKMCGIDEAMSDIKAGRTTTYKSSDDLFKKLGI
ncbi:MAG: hypothetical protein J6W37_09895 [Bacteroidales bacterium]|nr:hypothetical protein [Bacteroidales bacterium]